MGSKTRFLKSKKGWFFDSFPLRTLRKPLRTLRLILTQGSQSEPQISHFNIMTEEIKKELLCREKQYKIKILYAVESGSRTWGFALTDRDRFLLCKSNCLNSILIYC